MCEKCKHDVHEGECGVITVTAKMTNFLKRPINFVNTINWPIQYKTTSKRCKCLTQQLNELA